MVDRMKDDISSQHFADSTRNFDFPTQLVLDTSFAEYSYNVTTIF